MSTELPYVNHAYWKQLTLLNGGFDEVRQQFTVWHNSNPDVMRCCVELRHGSCGDWIELEGPIWQGPTWNVPALLNAMGDHLLAAQEYLQPF